MKYTVAVIGGGPAGYTAASAAAKAGLSVVLFEKQALGGVCLNEGCIPTKTLLYSAKTLDTVRTAGKYGIAASTPSFDLAKIQARKQKVVRKLVLGIKARLQADGVSVVQGEAFILGPNTISCQDVVYEVEHIVLATGSHTWVPRIPGLSDVTWWTHREALQCTQAPRTLCIIGGGVIGMEFASFFCSLGTEVTVIEMQPQILPGLDAEAAALLKDEYAKKGVKFLTSTTVESVERQIPDGILLHLKCGDAVTELPVEQLMVCVGRRPTTEGFGLENLHLSTTDKGAFILDRGLRASQPNVYIIGDLNGTSMLAHTAVREAQVVVANILGKGEYMGYRYIPSVVYTNPETAWVGATEASLKAKYTEYRAVRLPLTFSGRFIAENEGQTGLCKLLLDKENRLLGVHMVGNPASELIGLAVMAMEQGMTAEQWRRVVIPHPTVGEIFKEALL